jgi:anti-sigma factor RsiW
MVSFIYRARFMWEHRWTTAHLSGYVDDELTPPSRLRAERHLSECAECRRALAGLRGILEALHSLPTPSGGRDAYQIAAAVRRRLHEPPAG